MWRQRAKELLLRGRVADGRWGYTADGEACVEPTALASLALLALDPESESVTQQTRASAEWLASLQQDDGALGLSVAHRAPRWPTAHALLLWSALRSHEERRARAIHFLLSRSGTTAARSADSPTGHDTGIPGWPWVSRTHSWVEPTALAVLALARSGFGTSPRVARGLDLLCDRATPGGGWNYGNTTVFGKALRARPGPTGLALLALAAGGRTESSDAGLGYLSRQLVDVRSGQSLCWGMTALRAHGALPAAGSAWTRETFEIATRRRRPPLEYAYLLLAECPAALGVLGLGGRPR